MTPEELWRHLTSSKTKKMAVERLDMALREARAGGLDKAIEIAGYHQNLPARKDAFKAACRDIRVSCSATAWRIRRGEPEDPTSEVMQAGEEGKVK